MGTAKESSALQFRSWGFDLYTPPTLFSYPPKLRQGRFVMLDDLNNIFYDVDYETPRLENKTPWTKLALHRVPDPAIIFPPEEQDMLVKKNSATGILVSVTSRTPTLITAEKLGRVNVSPLLEKHMNWAALQSSKGDELPNEMRVGLLRRVWNRRRGAAPDTTPYVTPNHILNKMPRPWHTDGVALNYELDEIFVGGKVVSNPPSWRVYGLDAAEIELSTARAAVFIE